MAWEGRLCWGAKDFVPVEPQALSFHTAVLEPCGPSRSPGPQRPRQEAAAFAGRFAGPVKLRADSAGPQAVLNPSQASEPMIQALQSVFGGRRGS